MTGGEDGKGEGAGLRTGLILRGEGAGLTIGLKQRDGETGKQGYY